MALPFAPAGYLPDAVVVSLAHPTADEHAAMARDLEPVLREALGW